MKPILLLLLTCLPLCAATTYPMLSTTTNRTVTGGVTNMSLLNANQTFTGTNTFPAASFYPANNIGLRLLWSSPTNIFIPSVVVSASLSLTNNGDFSSCTYVAKATIPPLLGSNSAIIISGAVLRTNASASSAALTMYTGPNTNFVGYSTAFTGAAVGNSYMTMNTLFQNVNSLTNQMNGGNWILPAANVSVAGFADFGSATDIYIGAMTATGHTNMIVYGLKIYELYAP